MAHDLWAAFLNESNEILVASSPDGREWTSSRDIDNLSRFAPALAVFDSSLYVAFITDDNPVVGGIQGPPSNRIFVCTTSDGRCWKPTTFINHHSKYAPALAVFNNRLFIAYIANDSSNRIRFCSFTGATSWGEANDTGHESPQSPALVRFGENLQMVFISDDGKNAIRRCEMTPGGAWGGSSAIGHSSTFPPAAAVFDDDLFVAFVADDSTNNVFVSSASDWSQKTFTKQSSASAPSLAVSDDGGNRLFVGFSANDGSGKCLLTSSSNPSSPSGWPTGATDIRKSTISAVSLAIAPFASGPQPPYSLSCLLAGSAGPRVYYRAQSGFLSEVVVAAGGNPQPTPPWQGSAQRLVACGGAISCLYQSDGSRIYFPNVSNEIYELALGQDGSSKFKPCVVTADAQTALSCLLAGSSGTRVYYLATQHGQTLVNEVVLLNATGGAPEGPTSFSPDWQGNLVVPVPAQPNSPLTSVYISDEGSRVYYLDTKKRIVELALNYLSQDQVPDNIIPGGLSASFNQTGVPAASGGLTCLLAGSAGTRVYFLSEGPDGSTYPTELSIVNGNWQVTATCTGKARPGSALACLYIGGVGSRVYFIAHDGIVYEWALGGGAQQPTPSSGEKAANDSPLTCLYIGGSGSRVYYLDVDSNVREIVWDGGDGQVNPTPLLLELPR